MKQAGHVARMETMKRCIQGFGAKI